jgi:DNA-binding protein H-NS
MKTTSYEQVLKRIDALKAEAETLRQRELGDVVARIRGAIEHYGLTAADLGFGARAAKPASAAGPAMPARKTRRARKMRGGAAGKGARQPRVAKFRDEAGNTWVGRGKRPQWLRDALASGKTLQDFAVQ